MKKKYMMNPTYLKNSNLEIELIIGKIGELKKHALEELDYKLKKVFGLK